MEQSQRIGENHSVLHDLRIQVGDDTAPIDQLVINRAGHFILVETKCFAGDVEINEAGEFRHDSTRRSS